MTGSDVLALLATGIAGVMAIVVVYIGVKGTPGVVSLSPPPGSPRWPVYGFFAPWFLAGFVNSAADWSPVLLYVRAAEFVLVLIAFIVSWRRLKANPPLPPRI